MLLYSYPHDQTTLCAVCCCMRFFGDILFPRFTLCIPLEYYFTGVSYLNVLVFTWSFPGLVMYMHLSNRVKGAFCESYVI